jgi:hypothetical protein
MNYKKLVINPAIKRICIHWYNRFKWDYVFYWNSDLRILNIPNDTQLRIKGYFKECWCWASKTYYALWKDWILYNID